MHVDSALKSSRYVSLTVKPETVEDALLLALLGQRTFQTSGINANVRS
jgi:hypothetical protein